MTTIDEFLQEVRLINWFEHSKEAENKYHVIHSIFEAYDDWNAQMLKTWEPHTFSLERTAIKQIGDAQIDKVFSTVSSEIGDAIWKKWEDFTERWHLEEESGLENEMLDMVKRDVSWACIERMLNVQGFFSTLLEIYKDGYFPCAWIGTYPIWTEAIADAARLARQSRRRPTKMGEMGMFSGMMFCADCGSIMYQCRATNFRRDQEYYLCSGYRKSRDVCGQTHSIRTVILEELVLQNLREIVSFASQRKDDFVKMVMDADMRQRNRGLAKRQKTLADAEKRIAELDTIFKRLYEDTISGKLSDERFQKLSADYEKEQHELQELAAVLRGEIEAEERKSANVERFLSVVERYTEIPELTPCILHEFVEKIVVHAASDPKGKNRTQEIDIYYKGIGALEVSKVTSSRQE